MKTLFLGLADCPYSRRAAEHLRAIGFATTELYSANRHDHSADIAGWTGDIIISYRTAFILTPEQLNRAPWAINFHPASTDYPGSGSYSWALYDGATEFGSTAHIMTERIDAGPIVDCSRWPIYDNDTLESLFNRAQHRLYELFLTTISGIKAKGTDYIQDKLLENRDIKWAGPARRIRDLDLLHDIAPDCTELELNRRIRATNSPQYPLYITLHGRRFYYNDK